MRRTWVIGFVVVIAISGTAGVIMLRSTDPYAKAVKMIDAGDMRGAELYLRQARDRDPNNPNILFNLGKVDLALADPIAAERELRRARDRGYDPVKIIPLLGQSYLRSRRFDDALQEFSLAHAPKGGEAATLTVRAAAFLAERDIESATAAANDAAKLDPDSPEVLLTEAKVAIARNDVNTAEAKAKRLLQLDPTAQEPYLVMADVAMRRGNAKQALDYAQKVLDKNPRWLDARLAQAKAFMALDRLADASQAIDQVLSGSPRDIGGNYYKVVLAVRQGDFKAADQALNLISPALGDLPGGFYYLAVAKLGVSQPAQAAEAAAKFLAQNPKDLQAIKLMAFVDLASNRPGPAIELLQGAISAGQGDADVYDLIGRARAMHGDTTQAVENLTQAAKLAPKNPDILNRLAAAKLSAGDLTAAEAVWHQSLAVAPEQAVATEALVNAALARGDTVAARKEVEHLRQVVGDTVAVGMLDGNIRIAAFDFAGAHQVFNELLRRYPDSRNVKLALVRANGMLGNPEESERLLRDILTQHPDDEEALDILLKSLFAQNRGDEAVQLAETARAAAPTRLSIIATLAGAYVRNNQANKAITLLDRSGANTNPQLGYLRGDALMVAGRKDDARIAFSKVLDQDPGNRRAARAMLSILVQQHDFDAARAMVTEASVAAPGDTFLMGAKVGIEVRERGIRAGLATADDLAKDPKNLPAAYELPGDAWLSVGDPGRAADAYMAAFAQSPSAQLMNKAVKALNSAGRAPEAVIFLAKWLKDHPNDADAHGVQASLDIAQKHYDAAIVELRTQLALRPNDGAALNNLAWLTGERGDLMHARAIAQRAYFIIPSMEIADTLGWIVARQGDTADAVALLKMARDAKPEPSVRYHYAYALKLAGRNDEAKAELTKLLDEVKTFDDRQAAQAMLTQLGG